MVTYIHDRQALLALQPVSTYLEDLMCWKKTNRQCPWSRNRCMLMQALRGVMQRPLQEEIVLELVLTGTVAPVSTG